MGRRLRIDIFCEDRAHEELLRGLVLRVCAEEGAAGEIAARSATGGHGRALDELQLYQIFARLHSAPDLLVVAIDTNCRSYRDAVREIEAKIDASAFPHHALACPNPHIELWYMADADAFEHVVGVRPASPRPSCGKQTRNELKHALAAAVRSAGHPVLFGGIEFARELAQAMDPFVAGKVDAGLRDFVRDLRAAVRQLTSR